MNGSTDIFRRRFLRRLSLVGLGTAASLATVKVVAGEAPRIARPTYTALSIPDDWYICGYHCCYHGRSKDPKPFVDLIALVSRTGGCSAGFVRRLMIAMADDVAEANEGIAYLNRGIRDRWLIHTNNVPSGIPLENLERYFGIIPEKWPWA
jgi:hypothetical protein